MSSWKSSQRRLASAALVFSLGLAGCADTPDAYPPLTPQENRSYTLAELLESRAGAAATGESFSTMLAGYEAAGLRATLEGEGATTVLAPTDGAFALLPTDADGNPVFAPTTIQELANFSILPGEARNTATLIAAGTVATQLAGQNVSFSFIGEDAASGVLVNGVAQLYGADAQATNGYLFALDGVLFPYNTFPGNTFQAISAYPLFSGLLAAITQHDAPIKAAIEATEDETEKGILTATLLETALTAEGGTGLTVFAPMAPAWAGITDETSGEITFGREDWADLDDAAKSSVARNAVLYHVLGTPVNAAVLSASTTQATLADGSPAISVTSAGGVVTLNADADPETDDALVTWTDFATSNGIIHVVNQVLVPPAAP